MANEVRLIDAPAGLFRYCCYLGFKTEYMVDGCVEAYVVESGERFWAGVDTPKKVNNLLVTPVTPYSLRPKERWVFDSGVDYCYKCSECRAKKPPAYIDDNFCPNCGADMRG